METQHIVLSFHAPAHALPPHVIPSEVGRRFFFHHRSCDDVGPRSEESLLFLVFFANRHSPLATSSPKKLCHLKRSAPFALRVFLRSERSPFPSEHFNLQLSTFNFQPSTLSHRHPL